MGELCYRCMKETMVNGRCSACGKPSVQPSEYDRDILPPGTLLDGGNIVVGMPIGRGGFGVTYIAVDRKNGQNRRVALKEFVPRHMVSRVGREIVVDSSCQDEFEHALRAFNREARTLHELRGHPNVVKVYFQFEENHTAYYGMELLEGRSLKRWIREREKPLTAQDAFALLEPILDTLDYIHSRHVLHRDVGPNNIFLCDNPSAPEHPIPKLIDFGAAYVAMSHFTHSCALTKTDGYSPIEQLLWDVEKQGPWTDVYAFSATFYFAVTGKAPVASNLRYLEGTTLEAPSALGAVISPRTEAVLMEGLAVSPDERIQAAAVLKTRLAETLEVPPSQPAMGRRIGSILLEAALLYGMGQLVAQGFAGVICAYLCMALIDMALCFMNPAGTMGMRLTGLRLERKNGGGLTLKDAAFFSLYHAAFPLALADCLLHIRKGITWCDRLMNLVVAPKT